MTDLAREIEELLPCLGLPAPLLCGMRASGLGPVLCCTSCASRPTVLAALERVRRETIEAAALVCRHYHESEADEHPNDDERYGAICCEELILKLGGMNNAP